MEFRDVDSSTLFYIAGKLSAIELAHCLRALILSHGPARGLALDALVLLYRTNYHTRSTVFPTVESLKPFIFEQNMKVDPITTVD